MSEKVNILKKLLFYLVFFIITIVLSQITFYLFILAILPSSNGIMSLDITILTRILAILGFILTLGMYIFSLYKLLQQQKIDSGLVIISLFIFTLFLINFPAPAILTLFF